jgi:hypothetical protein
MKYLGKRFSFSMPGNKVDWPMEKKTTDDCGHADHRKFLIDGKYLCRNCKDRHGKLIVDIL